MARNALARRDIIIFSAAKYIEFGLKFIQGVLIAKLLGPYLFGIWGFLMLVQQYLLYTGLGFQDVVTVELSNKSDSKLADEEKIIAEALGATVVVALLLLSAGFAVQFFTSTLFEKYQFDRYIIWLTLLVGLTHIMRVLICAYRVYGRILSIAISQFLIACLPLLPLLWFRGNELIFAVLLSMIIATMASVILLVVLAPFRVYLRLNMAATRSLLVIGIPLLTYNFSFYLITISARTILSIFYSVEAMGYYALASSITNAILLGFKSVLFVILPDMIHRTREGADKNEARKTAHSASILYSTSVTFIALLTIILLPLLFRFLPEYKPATGTIAILLLSQIFLSATFGYNAAAIARGYHLEVAKISLISVLVVFLSGLFFAWARFDFTWMAVSVFFGAVMFLSLQTRLGIQLFDEGFVRQWNIFSIFSIENWGIVMICLIISLAGWYHMLLVPVLLVFIFVNRRNFYQLWKLRSGTLSLDS